MYKYLLLLALVGCMYSHVEGDPRQPIVGEYQNCVTTVDCDGIITVFDTKYICTDDVEVLQSELTYSHHQAAVHMGCKDTQCGTSCEGIRVACLTYPQE
jgi:hypothetical protein